MYALKNKTSSKALIAAVCLALTTFLVYDCKAVSQYTYEGIYFSARYVISAVFPFVFLSRLLIDTSALEIIADKLSPLMLKIKKNPYALPPFLLNIFCGFPVGAIYINDLYKKRLVTKKEADMLLPMCNNPSPAFVFGTVGATFLKSQRVGAMLWLINTFFSFAITMFLLPKHNGKKEKNLFNADSYSFSGSFVDSIGQSIKTALNIVGTVTVFYITAKMLTSILERYGISKGLTALCISILEIGNGCMYASALKSYSRVLCAFAVGFGGICVFFQVKAASHKGSMTTFYLFSKITCGLLCAFFAFFLL